MSDSSLYLDLIGGIAGDMFAAAIVDLEPELEALCHATVGGIYRLPDDITAGFTRHDETGHFGRRFRVTRSGGSNPHEDGHAHLSYREAKRIVEQSELPDPARQRALEIFALLAAAEGKVHEVAPDDVVFHEVGGWDSVIDIVLAARLIEELGELTWQCGSIPLGSGSVRCAHGTLPVPAPAVLELLRGFEVHQDGNEGERVTPTGAAILRHLGPAQLAGAPRAVLNGTGSGFGSREFEGLANVLRVYRLAEPRDSADKVMALAFDIDDQSPEDLAMALDDLRDADGVLDVLQLPAVGKKGRMLASIRILARPASSAQIIERILSATSTLGVRYHEVQRATLDRDLKAVSAGGKTATVKRVRRPDGKLTAKMEADDLRLAAGSYADSKALRREFEASAEAEQSRRPEAARGDDQDR